MRLDKFTLRAQEAIQAAIELAERKHNQQVEPEHLLAAMLEQPEGIVRPLLGKLAVNHPVLMCRRQLRGSPASRAVNSI